ncbi:MAG: XrtA/PEP-CTERM system TPR-repeat protein PrsT [Candidatus Reddybacter sp.]
MISTATSPRTRLLTTTLIISLLSMLSACSKPTEEEYFNRAKAALAEGNQQTAIIELKNTLLLNNSNSEARWLLGKAYLELLDGPSAEKELRKAMEQGLAAESALLPLAEAFYIQGKYDELIKLKLPNSLQSTEHKAQLFTLKGRSYLALSNFPSAERLFQQAQQLASNDPQVNTGIAALRSAQGKSDEAQKLLTQVLESNPEHVPAWQQLATLEQQQGNFEAALAAHSKAIEYSKHNSLDIAQRALVYIQLNRLDEAKKDLAQAKVKNSPIIDFTSGVIAILENRLEDAKESLQKVLNDIPNHMPATFYLGLASYKNGELEQAKILLTAFQKKYPNSVSANKLLGGINLALGDREAATVYLRKANASDPSDIKTIKLLGRMALDTGSSAEAIAYFSEVIEQEATNPENYLQLGRSYSAAGQPNAARNEFEQAVALNPELTTAEVGIIASYINNNEFELALNYVKNLQQERPEDTDPLVFESAIHLAMGNKQTAIEALEQALVLAPGDQAVSHNLASLTLQDGDFDGARKLYLGVLEHHPEHVPTIMRLAKVELISGREKNSLNLVQKAFEINPGSLEVTSTLASYHLKQGQPQKAMQLINQVPDGHTNDAAFYELRAKTEIALGQYHAANKTISDLLKLRPQSAEGYFLLAKVNAQLANGDTVLSNLQTALQLNPRHFEARTTLTRILAKNGAYEQSDAVLDSLVGVYGSHPQVLYLMGLRELRNNDAKYAYELFSKAASIEARGEYAIAMSNAQFSMRDTNEAVAILETWMKNNPNDLTVQYRLANVLLLLKRNDEAIVEFRNALRIKSDSVGALNNLAWLLREKSPDEAETLANKALEIAPESPQALHTLAMIKLNQNQPGKSVELLNKALDSSPDNYQLQYSLAKALGKDDQAGKAETLYRALLSKDNLPEELKTEIKAALKIH